MTTKSVEEIRALINRLTEYTPHAAALGICFECVEGERLTLRLPWREELIGNPVSGAIHTGALTVLMDHTLGLAIMCSDKLRPSVTPTLDLRVDHLGISTSRKDIMASAWVYKVTRKVVFVEGIAWCDSFDEPFAKGMGTFVIKQELDLQKFRESSKKWV